MTDIRRMQLGQVVDFVIAYNDRQREAEAAAERRSKAKHYRMATQEDIDKFFG